MTNKNPFVKWVLHGIELPLHQNLIYLPSPTAILEQLLRAIWDAASQAAGLILPQIKLNLKLLHLFKLIPVSSVLHYISSSLLKSMSTELVMLSNHLILFRPLLLLPSIFSSKHGNTTNPNKVFWALTSLLLVVPTQLSTSLGGRSELFMNRKGNHGKVFKGKDERVLYRAHS